MPKRTFLTANSELRSRNPNGVAVFATTGSVTPLASSEIKKLAWQVVQLKPMR